ncbi:Hypothetical predicted protein [Mytilus galloprovincialis]|uniref:Uncharacterized protein n=1 Tax=Mytilus galloprovincialis TaxID=29158 RepID=A0A8B6G9C8_MYTGA|nr:Hypothetical predicted protein [Mytilus galloprovincialis]
MDEIAKIGKAVASVCKEDDNRSDDIMMMASDSNWDQFLTPAPCAIALLGDLILISANTDFNLDEQTHRDGFKKPRYPNSFQESLVQVSNAGLSAFNEAHTSMDQIRLHSVDVDGQVKNAVKLLMQGTPEEVKRMLPISLSKIQNIVDESLLLAKASEDRFVGVIELEGELLEASTNTKGVYGKKTKEKEIAIEVARTEFRMKEIKKAQSEFKEAINILPLGGDLIGIAVCEALMEGVRNITTFPSKMSEGIKKKQSGSLSAVTAAIENARYKTELAKETLRDAKRHQEKLAKELSESNEKLTKVLMNMTKLESKEIDFATIRETLVKGINALSEVREQWGKLVHFFQLLSNLIRGCLHSSLTDFVEQAIIGREIQMTNDDAPLSNKLRDVIFEQASKASQVAYNVRTITGTYVQISNEHLMDRITCLGLLVALDPRKDELEIRRKHEELHNGCQEAQKTILSIVMNAGNMSVVQARIHEKYKYNFEKVLEYLLKGLEHLSVFIQYLNEINGGRCKDDDKYIAKVLFPLIEKAKKEFDEMSTYAEGLLQQINSDFERCVADLKVNNDKLKEIDSNLNELEKELQGTKKSVDNANDQCRRKREDLTAAENTLSDARRKLEDAKTTQATTSTAGVATTVVSAFLTLLIPPLGLAGMAAGVGTGIVSGTALEEAVSLCSNNCSSACSEVQSSESALERAKNAKTEVENKLDSANKKKQQTKTQMEDVKSDKNRLEEYRNLIIIFGEDYKKFNRQLCDFYGKYKILRCETSGGYSLCMLQSPTKMLGTSLSSLCKCVAIQTLCEQPMQAIMRKHLLQIECVKWQTDDECSDIDHLI